MTTDLTQDPTLARRLRCSFPYIYSLLYSRHTPTLLAQTAVTRSTLFYLLAFFRCRFLVRCSTKINRKEKRLVWFISTSAQDVTTTSKISCWGPKLQSFRRQRTNRRSRNRGVEDGWYSSRLFHPFNTSVFSITVNGPRSPLSLSLYVF